MREIKFRGKAFVPNARVSLSWEYAAYDDDHWDLFWKYVDQATLGQYTGIKDENGKEIYEGDIVQWEGAGDVYKRIVRWDDDEARFFPSSMSLGVVILGNRYDNPELLEGAK